MNNPRSSANIITDTVVGSILGIWDATQNTSPAHSMVSSAGAGLFVSAVNTWPLKRQKFFSAETALSTLTITGSSVISHLITSALIHQHYTPKITYANRSAEDCTPCKIKSWAEHASQTSEYSQQR